MKKSSLCLGVFLLSTIFSMAERGDHGRDYLLREDSSFLSPGKVIVVTIIIVCCYWLLRGLLAIPDYFKTISKKNKQIFLLFAVIGLLFVVAYAIDLNNKHPYTTTSYFSTSTPHIEEKNIPTNKSPQSLVDSKTINSNNQIPVEPIEATIVENNHQIHANEPIKPTTKDNNQEKQNAYLMGIQKGYFDGMTDGYYDSSVSSFGVCPPIGKGKLYNQNSSYRELELKWAYEDGYDIGYNNGIITGYRQREVEYERELEAKRKAWDEENAGRVSIFEDPINGVFIADRP